MRQKTKQTTKNIFDIRKRNTGLTSLLLKQFFIITTQHSFDRVKERENRGVVQTKLKNQHDKNSVLFQFYDSRFLLVRGGVMPWKSMISYMHNVLHI
jgi:hypothetical protein